LHLRGGLENDELRHERKRKKNKKELRRIKVGYLAEREVIQAKIKEKTPKNGGGGKIKVVYKGVGRKRRGSMTNKENFLKITGPGADWVHFLIKKPSQPGRGAERDWV